MQIIYTLLQTDNLASTSSLVFLWAGCQNNSVKALKATQLTIQCIFTCVKMYEMYTCYKHYSVKSQCNNVTIMLGLGWLKHKGATSVEGAETDMHLTKTDGIRTSESVVFSTMLIDWMGRMSLKWSAFCVNWDVKHYRLFHECIKNIFVQSITDNYYYLLIFLIFVPSILVHPAH